MPTAMPRLIPTPTPTPPPIPTNTPTCQYFPLSARINTSSGPPETPVFLGISGNFQQCDGGYFQPRLTVTVFFDGQELARFSCYPAYCSGYEFKVPEAAAAGLHTIRITTAGEVDWQSASKAFTFDVVPPVTPTTTPLPPPIPECPDLETELEVLLRTVAGLGLDVGCTSNRVAAGRTYSDLARSLHHGFKLPYFRISITRFDSEAEAAAVLGTANTLFNNCPAFFFNPPLTDQEEKWQVSRWVFGIKTYNDGSSLFKPGGLDIHTFSERLYAAGVELGLVPDRCP